MVRDLKATTGCELQGLTTALQRLSNNMLTFRRDFDAMRDTITVHTEAVQRFLPMNSLKGMRRLFRASA